MFPRFFINYDATAEMLKLPSRGIKIMWDLLDILNSTHRIVDIIKLRLLAKTLFEYMLIHVNVCSSVFCPPPPPPSHCILKCLTILILR